LTVQTWQDLLREKRLAYGVSQSRIAALCGISQQHYSSIESGSFQPSETMRDTLLQIVERLSFDEPLTMMFDYVRIRFPTNNVKHVVEDILRIKLSYMIHENFGFYSYTEHYYLGDIFVLTSEDAEKGILVELKGKGCRQFESYLIAQGRSWYSFFAECLADNAIMKRIDLAINDRAGILDIPALTQKCINEECISLFHSFKSYHSGKLVKSHEENKLTMGNTLYIGSLKSEIYFCIYQKDYEQYKKLGIPIEDAEVKNRFEIRLRNDRAYDAIYDLLTYEDPERTAFEIINRYIRFVDRDNTKPHDEWELSPDWAYFIGEYRESMKLTTQPEPYSIERTLQWLSHQVAPTFKMVMELDELYNTDNIQRILDGAEFTDKHKKILRQHVATVDKIII